MAVSEWHSRPLTPSTPPPLPLHLWWSEDGLEWGADSPLDTSSQVTLSPHVTASPRAYCLSSPHSLFYGLFVLAQTDCPTPPHPCLMTFLPLLSPLFILPVHWHCILYINIFIYIYFGRTVLTLTCFIAQSGEISSSHNCTRQKYWSANSHGKARWNAEEILGHIWVMELSWTVLWIVFIISVTFWTGPMARGTKWKGRSPMVMCVCTRIYTKTVSVRHIFEAR